MRAIQERVPNIVISDIEMPEMDGYALCNAIKSNPSLRGIPVHLVVMVFRSDGYYQGSAGGCRQLRRPSPDTPEFLLSRVDALLQTPLDERDISKEQPLEVTLDGKQYVVKSGRQQAVNLLVSQFPRTRFQKNRELSQANQRFDRGARSIASADRRRA